MGNFFGDIGRAAGTAWEQAEDFVPGIGDSKAQDKANKLNAKEALANREFQERMSNTAYQRGTEDMKKAGLNPMLAFTQGPASSPSGGAATAQAASKTRLGDMALQAGLGVSNAQNQSKSVEQQQAMTESNIKLNNVSSAKTAADTSKSIQETERIRLENKKAKKHEPIDNVLGKASSLAERQLNKVLNMFDSSSKDIKRREEKTKELEWDFKNNKVKAKPGFNIFH